MSSLLRARGRLQWHYPVSTSSPAIDILPDDALLEIFDFYLGETKWTDGWHILVHVCRRWRLIVFGSSRRLNLQLVCTHRTPVRRMLDVWLPFPIVLEGNFYSNLGEDNIIATLEHNHRVCKIELRHIPNSQWENVLTVMQEPFPILTNLSLLSRDNIVSVVPGSFLGGSTPRLRKLVLGGIPFPGLPKLLLSATHLVHLKLLNIPHSGYFSPESMVTCLLALTRLESLTLKFESPRPRLNRENRRLPPLTRTLLHSLTHFTFKGVSEYLEDIVAWVDTPLLDHLDIIFFRQLIFDTTQLAQFISRIPKLNAHDQAHVTFSDWGAFVTFPRRDDTHDRRFHWQFAISCTQPDWHVLSMAQICNSILPAFSTLEHLYISDRGRTQQRWHGDIENSEWLELLRPFTAVKSLYLAEEHTPHIIPALQEVVGERVPEVLPALEYLFLEKPYQSGFVQKAIEKLIAVRRLSNHPIVISLWQRYNEWTATLNLNGTRIPVQALMAEAVGDMSVILSTLPNELEVEPAIGPKLFILDIQVWIRQNKLPMIRLSYVDGTDNWDFDQLVEKIRAYGYAIATWENRDRLLLAPLGKALLCVAFPEKGTLKRPTPQPPRKVRKVTRKKNLHPQVAMESTQGEIHPLATAPHDSFFSE